MSESSEAKIKRCIIYTRKSTEKGLEQDYNSLDAQRESAENYIKSQNHNGWQLLPTHYDDGGYSGGTTERPALKRLMEDIKAGGIDVIVVYKLDRLSRSLLDFMNLAEFFEQHNVGVISVTQDINTSTSSGRMMLNILMTFCQFERESTRHGLFDGPFSARQQRADNLFDNAVSGRERFTGGQCREFKCRLGDCSGQHRNPLCDLWCRWHRGIDCNGDTRRFR